MSSELEIFDSLPYYDNDLEKYPELRQKVDRELAKETKPQSELHPRVPPVFELFTNRPILAAELTRVAAHESLTAIDAIRYQLPAPGAGSTDEEYQASLKNAYAQLEHQRLRSINLSLLQTYGSNSWRVNNYLQEATAKLAEKELEARKEQTVEINRSRKNQQDLIGKQLTTLETRWTELISSVLQIEMANMALDADIEQLNKKEAELAESLSST